MSKETIILFSGIITAPFLGILVTAYFNKRKTSAETHNLNISGEISIGDAWQKYAKNMEARFAALEAKFDILKQEKETLALETKEKDKKILELEKRIDELEIEVQKYKTQASPDHLAEVAHKVIDEVKLQANQSNQ